MNNSGGERSLRYGQTRDFVERVSMVLSDGNEYEFGPLNADELKDKMNQEDFEGSIYRQIVGLYEKNKDSIEAAEPQVTKNSAGYALWRLWDKETDTFNMAQLFVGSQGTLGVMTNAKLKLLEDKKHSRLIVLFFKSWNDLPDVVNAVLPLDPESLETFEVCLAVLARSRYRRSHAGYAKIGGIGRDCRGLVR
jgi:FAD/FMN-containing dehydrogenase